MSSPRKPYQKLGSSRLKFFSAPARHLMESGSSESVFEKPYLDKEYGAMHQDPNTPDVSAGGGLGEGFNCYYSDSVCGEGIECFIGTSIPATGGPYEAQAGFREPVAQEGEIVSYNIDGANGRHILINVDPGKVTHSILIEYVDSYGKVHTKAITLDCDFIRDLWQRMDLFGLGDLWGPERVRAAFWEAYFDNTYWEPDNEDDPPLGEWVGGAWLSKPNPNSSDWYRVQLTEIGSWVVGFRPEKMRITHTNDGDVWTSFTRNGMSNAWSVVAGTWNDPVYDSTGSPSYELVLQVDGAWGPNWWVDYRPTKVRATHDGGANVTLTITDSESNVIITQANYTSGDEIAVTGQETDIYRLSLTGTSSFSVSSLMSSTESHPWVTLTSDVINGTNQDFYSSGGFSYLSGTEVDLYSPYITYNMLRLTLDTRSDEDQFNVTNIEFYGSQAPDPVDPGEEPPPV